MKLPLLQIEVGAPLAFATLAIAALLTPEHFVARRKRWTTPRVQQHEMGVGVSY